MTDLQREEERIAQEEELEIKQKREAAQQLALERGLGSRELKASVSTEIKPDDIEQVKIDTSVKVDEMGQDPISPVESSPTSPQDALETVPAPSTKDDIDDGKDPT